MAFVFLFFFFFFVAELNATDNTITSVQRFTVLDYSEIAFKLDTCTSCYHLMAVVHIFDCVSFKCLFLYVSYRDEIIWLHDCNVIGL